jgi:hypothetical protein
MAICTMPGCQSTAGCQCNRGVTIAPAILIVRDGTVNDIPDEELLGRAVRGARARVKSQRWAAVADLFALGSTYSAQLCRRFGVDPDEYVKRQR